MDTTITLTTTEAQALADLLDTAHGFGGGSFRLQCMSWQQILKSKLEAANNSLEGNISASLGQGRTR